MIGMLGWEHSSIGKLMVHPMVVTYSPVSSSVGWKGAILLAHWWFETKCILSQEYLGVINTSHLCFPRGWCQIIRLLRWDHSLVRKYVHSGVESLRAQLRIHDPDLFLHVKPQISWKRQMQDPWHEISCRSWNDLSVCQCFCGFKRIFGSWEHAMRCSRRTITLASHGHSSYVFFPLLHRLPPWL